MTRERPIPFRAFEVRAILAGLQTQTRCVVRAPAEDLNHPAVHHWQMDQENRAVAVAHSEEVVEQYITTFPHYRIRCPYGVPGDLLWVRETWEEVHPCQVDEGRFSLEGHAGIPGPPNVAYRIIYRADGEYPRVHFQCENLGYPYRERCLPGCQREHRHPEETWHGWKSSLSMPRWASRITLEITDVRVQRLQDISEEDAVAEGVMAQHCRRCGYTYADCGIHMDHHLCGAPAPKSAASEYRNLWDGINGKRAPWEANPWVWALTFQKLLRQ